MGLKKKRTKSYNYAENHSLLQVTDLKSDQERTRDTTKNICYTKPLQ